MKTRDFSVYPRKCLSLSCSGAMNMEMTDRQLYTQMQYFEKLFDAESTRDNHSSVLDSVEMLIQENYFEIQELSKVISATLETNSRRWVDLGHLFAF